ncbi:MAG: hypothetical protein HY889_02390 [Deltaproteobacteria bacterium]|nr:hypothetical protein [Deltaproteobacteria bacterium]
MRRFPTVLRTVTLSLFSAALFAGAAHAGEISLREKLVESKAFTAVYAVDDYLTMTTVPASADQSAVYEGFKALCTGNGAALDRAPENNNGEVYGCAGSFTVSAAEVSSADAVNRSFLITHSAPQPLNYRTPAVPSYAGLSTPPNGKLKESYSSADLYQYVYALCKRVNGTPAFVVPRRYGKYVRLTRIAPADAFKYLVASGDKKDAWYAACEGEKKFMLEKEYKYSPNGPQSLVFHSNRGLEGINFVRAEDMPSYVSKLIY